MPKNPLHITISGPMASGKSTVTRLLQNLLSIYGAEVRVSPEELREQQEEEIPDHMVELIQGLKDRVVSINTQTVKPGTCVQQDTPKVNQTLLHETLVAVCETYYRNTSLADQIYERHGESLGGFTGIWQELIQMATWLEEMCGRWWAADHGSFPEDVEDITRRWMDLLLEHGRVDRVRLHQLVLEHFIRQAR